MSDNKRTFKIYGLPHYNIKKVNYDKYLYESESIEKVVKKLEKNKGYNLRINPENKCIIYVDFDKANEEVFDKFLLLLCDKLDIEKKDISYSSSKNNTSFHITIPSIKTTSKVLHKWFSGNKQFSEFKNYIDLSVYSNRFYRLPNQT